MAFTSYPAAGEDLTAATLQALISELRPLFARKTVDETVNNSAVLQNDDALVLTVEANATYRQKLRLIVNSGTTPDFKADFVGPSGATASFEYQALETAPSAGLQGPFTQASTFAIGTTGSDQIILITGIWVISSTPGNIQFRWAQNLATASNTSVKANSYFELLRRS